jgi:hypothetical protein
MTMWQAYPLERSRTSALGGRRPKPGIDTLRNLCILAGLIIRQSLKHKGTAARKLMLPKKQVISLRLSRHIQTKLSLKYLLKLTLCRTSQNMIIFHFI